MLRTVLLAALLVKLASGQGQQYQVEIFRPSGIPDPGNPYCLGAIPNGNVPAWYSYDSPRPFSFNAVLGGGWNSAAGPMSNRANFFGLYDNGIFTPQWWRKYAYVYDSFNDGTGGEVGTNVSSLEWVGNSFPGLVQDDPFDFYSYNMPTGTMSHFAEWVDPNTDGMAFGPLTTPNHVVRVRYLSVVNGVPDFIQMWDETTGSMVVSSTFAAPGVEVFLSRCT